MRQLIAVLLVLSLLAGVVTLAQPDSEDEFVFGVVLFNRWGNRGSSYSHYAAARYVEQTIPNTRMVLVENMNPIDAAGRSLTNIITQMVEQDGARLIITTSPEHEQTTLLMADIYPDVTFVNFGGDSALLGSAPPNFANISAQIEWGMLMAGCAAALETDTHRIGFVGTQNTPQARRLASSAFLGAKHCFEYYRALSADDLDFSVTWIGYWFRTPASLNPSEVVTSYYRNGADVVISSIDSSEAMVAAGLYALDNSGAVKVIPFDYDDACDIAQSICLGMPKQQWHGVYVRLVRSLIDGATWRTDWEWLPPNWQALNDPVVSPVGFEYGGGLTTGARARLEHFIATLGAFAANPMLPRNEFDLGAIALWDDIQLIDGSQLAPPGQVADPLDVWYLPQLVRGMEIAPNSR